VVAVIVPWNFPMLIMAFKVPAALLTGNTVVIKPAATTPLTTLCFGGLIADIVPAGVVNVVSDANDLGDVLTTHPDVAKVSFTGSTATGLKVMANAAKSLKRVTLELGGNDAGIVLDDADPAAIAEGIYRGAFFNSGQACIALKRLYVPDAMYEDMCQALGAIAARAKFGEGSGVNPLQNKMQYDRVKGLLAEARKEGRIVAGGAVPEGGGYYIQPTVVADVREGMRIVDEEQFGPILPVLRYTDLDDAIRRANGTNYGLGASVWSSDVKRAQQVAERLVAGTVWINQHIDLGPHIPQAGAKQSGFGVELGDEGLHEFTQVQVINIKQ
jgi:acyl-CoA reductase-like NAD-dependent aldehyde dehydrogenase